MLSLEPRGLHRKSAVAEGRKFVTQTLRLRTLASGECLGDVDLWENKVVEELVHVTQYSH